MRFPMAWPLAGGKGRVTSRFGPRKNPLSLKNEHHNGLDIAAEKGHRVVAVEDGKVIFAAMAGAGGLTVRIEHEENWRSGYCHLDSIQVGVGQEVKRGEVIGRVGTTGRSTGYHLHLGIAEHGRWKDPEVCISRN